MAPGWLPPWASRELGAPVNRKRMQRVMRQHRLLQRSATPIIDGNGVHVTASRRAAHRKLNLEARYAAGGTNQTGGSSGERVYFMAFIICHAVKTVMAEARRGRVA